MFELVFAFSSTHAECIKSVADILSSVDVPNYLYCHIIVCCEQQHLLYHLYFEKLFLKLILLVIEQAPCIYKHYWVSRCANFVVMC